MSVSVILPPDSQVSISGTHPPNDDRYFYYKLSKCPLKKHWCGTTILHESKLCKTQTQAGLSDRITCRIKPGDTISKWGYVDYYWQATVRNLVKAKPGTLEKKPTKPIGPSDPTEMKSEKSS